MANGVITQPIDLQINKIRGLDKLSSLDLGKYGQMGSVLEAVKTFRKIGASASVAATSAVKMFGKFSDIQPSNEQILDMYKGIYRENAKISARQSRNKKVSDLRAAVRRYEKMEDSEAKEKLGASIYSAAGRFLGSTTEKFTPKQIETFEKYRKDFAQFAKEEKKQPDRIAAAFARQALSTALDAVSEPNDKKRLGKLWGGALDTIGQMGPWGAAISAIAKIITAGIAINYEKAANAYQGIMRFGPKYRHAAAEAMAGAETGFGVEHYQTMADQASRFQGQVAMGAVSESRWTGLAYLPNYAQALASGASVEEQMAALEKDRRNAPNESLFRQWLSMAEVPDEARLWMSLSGQQKRAILGSAEVAGREADYRAEAKKKIQGEGGVLPTSTQWQLAGMRLSALATGDADTIALSTIQNMRNGGGRKSIFGKEVYDQEKLAEAESVVRRRIAEKTMSSLPFDEQGRPITVTANVYLPDGTLVHSETQSQNDVIDNNYLFTGGAN